jgi:hypothetical protein
MGTSKSNLWFAALWAVLAKITSIVECWRRFHSIMSIIKQFASRRWDGPSQLIHWYQRKTSCFQECAFQGWSSRRKDVWVSRQFQRFSLLYCSWKQCFQQFCRRCHQGEEQLHLCRHPKLSQIYLKTMTSSALVFENTFSDFNVSFRNVDVGFFDLLFLLSGHWWLKLLINDPN